MKKWAKQVFANAMKIFFVHSDKADKALAFGVDKSEIFTKL